MQNLGSKRLRNPSEGESKEPNQESTSTILSPVV